MEADNLKLHQLLHGIAADADLAKTVDVPITGVFDDSRRVKPGGLFVALAGATTDGRRFIDDALMRGAAAIVSEGAPETQSTIHSPQSTSRNPQFFSVSDARRAIAQIAARWFGLTRDRLANFKLAAVTGTNGKSTTAYMTRAILSAAGQKCGLLGTVHYDLCSRTVTADMTTPGPVELCSYLRECADAGAAAAVMEVSSHALHQKRADGLAFAAAAFTNLTGDHLDYHGTMENYRDAKARLFAGLDEHAVAVVNADNPAHNAMIADCKARIWRYSLNQKTEISAKITRDTIRGTFYRLRIAGADIVLENALVGKHNVYNALAAAGLAHALGASPRDIEAGLSALRNVPGRLQRVPCGLAADVFVDYAHTDDALRNVLSVLKPLTRRRLMLVFGCGGDRDRTKRPRMAKAAAEFADCIMVTSDNPRTEHPGAIIEEILVGFEAKDRRHVTVQPDRGLAIRAALAAAHEGDVVLIAGKGHENYQIVGREKHHFDDVEVAIQAAAELNFAPTGVA